MKFTIAWHKSSIEKGTVEIEAPNSEKAIDIAWDNLSGYKSSLKFDPDNSMVECRQSDN